MAWFNWGQRQPRNQLPGSGPLYSDSPNDPNYPQNPNYANDPNYPGNPNMAQGIRPPINIRTGEPAQASDGMRPGGVPDDGLLQPGVPPPINNYWQLPPAIMLLGLILVVLLIFAIAYYFYQPMRMDH
jgi:hypothetical protein